MQVFSHRYFAHSIFALTGIFETWHYSWLACIRFYRKYIYVTGLFLKHKCKLPNFIQLNKLLKKSRLENPYSNLPSNLLSSNYIMIVFLDVTFHRMNGRNLEFQSLLKTFFLLSVKNNFR